MAIFRCKPARAFEKPDVGIILQESTAFSFGRAKEIRACSKHSHAAYTYFFKTSENFLLPRSSALTPAIDFAIPQTSSNWCKGKQGFVRTHANDAVGSPLIRSVGMTVMVLHVAF